MSGNYVKSEKTAEEVLRRKKPEKQTEKRANTLD